MKKCFWKPLALVHKLEHSLTATTVYKKNLFRFIPVSFRFIPVHPGVIPVHSGPFRSIPVHSGPFRSIPVSFRFIPVHSGPFRCHSCSFRSIPVHSTSFRFIPLRFGVKQRPHFWVASLCQNESTWETIHTKMCFPYRFISMQIKLNLTAYERFCAGLILKQRKMVTQTWLISWLIKFDFPTAGQDVKMTLW